MPQINNEYTVHIMIALNFVMFKRFSSLECPGQLLETNTGFTGGSKKIL